MAAVIINHLVRRNMRKKPGGQKQKSEVLKLILKALENLPEEDKEQLKKVLSLIPGAAVEFKLEKHPEEPEKLHLFVYY